MNPRIKMRHLLAFVEVARRGGVSKAALALDLTQSAVSRSMSELESILEVRLLRRHAQKGVSLTRFGDVFLRHAEQILAMVRQGEDAVARARGGPGHNIVLGALPYIAARIVPRAICAFMRDNPALTVRVVTGDNSVLLDLLKAGEVDLILCRLVRPKEMDGAVFEHLYSERLALVVRPGHPLLKPRRGGQEDRWREILREVAQHILVLLPPKSNVRDEIERLFMRHGVALPEQRMETEDVAFARGMALAGDAVWCVPLCAAEDELKNGILKEIPANMEETYGAVGVAARANAPASPERAALMEKIRAATAEVRDKKS